MTTNRRDYGSGGIQPRGKHRWRVQVEMGRDPVTGRRRRRRFTVQGPKRDAQQALREALSERDHGIDIAPEKLTLAEYLQRWFPEYRQRRRLKDSTAEGYATIVRKHIVPHLGAIQLRELRAEHLRGLYGRDELTESNLRLIYVILNRAMTDAVRSALIAINPCQRLEPPARVGRRTERRSLDDSEITQLVEAARGTAVTPPIRLALQTGMRQGELLALRWDDVDLEGRTVTVQRTARHFTGRGVLMTEAKTANSHRTIELSESAVRLLRDHRQAQRQHRLQVGPAWEEHRLVFPSETGTPWNPRNLYRAYRRVVDQSDLDDPGTVNFHTLRHTAATQWIKAGADVHIVSRRLGHASAAFTMNVYGHLLPGMQKVAAEAMDHLFA